MEPLLLVVVKEHACHHTLCWSSKSVCATIHCIRQLPGMLQNCAGHKGTASVLLKTVQASRSQSTITGSKEKSQVPCFEASCLSGCRQVSPCTSDTCSHFS